MTYEKISNLSYAVCLVTQSCPTLCDPMDYTVSRDFSHVSLVALSVTNPVLDTEQKFNKYTLKLIV